MSGSEDRRISQGDQGGGGRPAWELPADLKPLEARLAALLPRDDRLDRERLMFLAGQASAEPINRPVSPEGSVRNEDRWKRAFAAMTAIAATLLFVLLSRPAAVVPTPNSATNLANSGRRAETIRQSSGDAAAVNAAVLSAGDARRGDIEQLLATRSERPLATMPADARDRPRPALTPAAWRQIANGPEPTAPPAGDSSALLNFQGINS